jgi:Na+-transporting NADH:ubiquinone oxidoreductase subunit NqrC
MGGLFMLNLFLIFCIIFFLVVYVMKNTIDKQNLQKQINEMSFLDLYEFNTLNPDIKAVYKKLIVEKVYAAFIDKFNTDIANQKIDVYVKENWEKIATLVDTFVVAMKSGLPVIITKDNVVSMIEGIPKK